MKTGIELINSLTDLLIDEDLTDEKLRDASEGLLPNLLDYLNGVDGIGDGISLILKERREQIEKHGFNVNNDEIHYKNGELKNAAMYCLTLNKLFYPKSWGGWFRENIAKKTLKLSNVEFDIEMRKIAGALIAADIDRLQAMKEKY